MEDIRWLGFDWDDRLFYASDYFEQLYEWAVELIRKGKAYVCDLSAEEIREYRGTLTEPGKDSPYRDRSRGGEPGPVRSACGPGEFPDGARILRAKIDMASPNMNMRDPVMYRILHADASPHRATRGASTRCTTGPTASRTPSRGSRTRSARWSSRIHRPLYDWFLDQLGIYHPRQIEFARLNLTYTVMSKRKLLRAGARRATSAAGTIRACRPCRACAGAATRPRRSAISATGSAWPRPTAPSTSPCWSTACART